MGGAGRAFGLGPGLGLPLQKIFFFHFPFSKKYLNNMASNDQEELPDLDDPDVQKAASKIRGAFMRRKFGNSAAKKNISGNATGTSQAAAATAEATPAATATAQECVEVTGMLFDLDGTLLDFEGVSHIALNEVLCYLIACDINNNRRK